MQIRQRLGRCSNSWQVDIGIVGGKRRQKSFKTRTEAEDFLLKVKGCKKSTGDRGVETAFVQTKEWRDALLAVEAMQKRNAELSAEISKRDSQIEELRGLLVMHAHAAKPPPDVLTAHGGQVFPMMLAGVSGIYFLCEGDEVVYIGQAICVLRRIAQHKERRRFTFDSCWWLPCPPQDLTEREYKWINRLLPRHNRWRGPGRLYWPR